VGGKRAEEIGEIKAKKVKKIKICRLNDMRYVGYMYQGISICAVTCMSDYRRSLDW
jgi:hypothetical protein